MANGSHKPGPAMADRIREAGVIHQRRLRQAMEEERAAQLQPYRAEMESDSQVTAGPSGLSARGIPRFAWWPISIGIGLAIAMFAWAAIRLAMR